MQAVQPHSDQIEPPPSLRDPVVVSAQDLPTPGVAGAVQRRLEEQEEAFVRPGHVRDVFTDADPWPPVVHHAERLQQQLSCRIIQTATQARRGESRAGGPNTYKSMSGTALMGRFLISTNRFCGRWQCWIRARQCGSMSHEKMCSWGTSSRFSTSMTMSQPLKSVPTRSGRRATPSRSRPFLDVVPGAGVPAADKQWRRFMLTPEPLLVR